MVKTISELKAQSAEVKNASAIGENTATRVGQLFGDIVEHVEQYENAKNNKDASQDAQMQSLVSAEESRAKGEERGLQNQIHAEKIDRQTADTYLGNLIQQESSARETADENIRTALANETARAQAAEQELAAAQIYTSKIKDGAVTTPKIADGAVTYEKTDIIAQELGTNMTKVPSQKVVTDAIQREETERKADINGLTAALASETIQREQGDENLNAAIEAEINGLTTALASETIQREQGDENLNAAIEAEKDRAEAREQELTVAIQQETDRAMSAEYSITGRVNETNQCEFSKLTTTITKVFTYITKINNSKVNISVHDISVTGAKRFITYKPKAPNNPYELSKTENGFSGSVNMDGYEAGTTLVMCIMADSETPSGTLIIDIEEINVNDITLETVKEIQSNLSELKKNTLPFNGLVGVIAGDSHAVGRKKWVPYLFDKLGITYDKQTTANIVGAANSCGEGYEVFGDPFYCQAIRAVEAFKSGKKIDIIFVENVHYVDNSNINDAFPYKVKKVIDLGKRNIVKSKATEWFDSNINEILKNEQKEVGSLVYMQCQDTKYILTFNGIPKEGEIILTLDGYNFNAIITGNESINEAVEKLGVWAFSDYTDWTNSIQDNTIILTYSGDNIETPVPVISFNSGNTEISMAEGTEQSYFHYRRYFESYNTENDWFNPEKWKLAGGWYGYKGLKGFYETLIENIPNLLIICVSFPCYAVTNEQFKTELGYNMSEFYKSSFYSANRARAETFIKAGEYYNVKVIDVEKLCNITLNNWFDFYPSGDVHPNENGYKRWADTIIKELI